MLDPGHGASVDGPLTRQVPNGRGGHQGLPDHRHLDQRRVPRAHVHLGRRVADPSPARAARRQGRHDAQRRHRARAVRRCARGARQRRSSPPRSSASTATAARRPATASTSTTRARRSTPRRAGVVTGWRTVMRDALAASGLTPSTYIGSERPVRTRRPRGPQPRRVPGSADRTRQHAQRRRRRQMTSPQGQAAYAAAVVQGLTSYRRLIQVA